jgi:hypothetical protein
MRGRETVPETSFFAVPPPTHVVYIPFVLMIGFVIGFLAGRRAGVAQGKAEFLGGGDDEL